MHQGDWEMKYDRVAMFFTGIGIGVAAGLLFTRYSGVELRKQITDRAGDAKTFLKDHTAALRDRLTEAAGEMKQQVETGRDVVRDLNRKATDIIGDAAIVATDAADEIAKKSRTLASQASKVIERQGESLNI
jgi:gas vesicle protein